MSRVVRVHAGQCLFQRISTRVVANCQWGREPISHTRELSKVQFHADVAHMPPYVVVCVVSFVSVPAKGDRKTKTTRVSVPVCLCAHFTVADVPLVMSNVYLHVRHVCIKSTCVTAMPLVVFLIVVGVIRVERKETTSSDTRCSL